MDNKHEIRNNYSMGPNTTVETVAMPTIYSPSSLHKLKPTLCLCSTFTIFKKLSVRIDGAVVTLRLGLKIHPRHEVS